MDKNLRARWVARFALRLAGPLSSFDAERFSKALGSVQEARAMIVDVQSALLHFVARPARSDLTPLRHGLANLSRELGRLEHDLDRAEDQRQVESP